MVSRGEWSVSTMYSWPSAMAARAIASIVAPPSLQLEWSVAVALERGAGAPRPRRRGSTVLGLELGEVRSGTSPASASVMTAAVLVADAGQLGQGAVARPGLELALGQLARPRRRRCGTPSTLGLGERARSRQVHDALEGLERVIAEARATGIRRSAVREPGIEALP